MENDLSTKEIFYRRNLPHWYVAGASYFLTWRLAGTLPISVIEKLRSDHFEQQLLSLSMNAKNDSFFSEYDKLLDRSETIRYLKEERIATICADALKFYDKKQYELIAFCIM